MIISLTTQLSVRDRKPALSPLTFRNITSGQGAQSLLSTAATPDKMLLILICILRLVTQRQAVLGQPAIKGVMGLLGNLKSAIRGRRGANWCMRNCQSRVELAERVPVCSSSSSSKHWRRARIQSSDVCPPPRTCCVRSRTGRVARIQ